MGSDILKIYIDGSAYKNPGHSGGIAGIISYPDCLDSEPKIIFYEGYKQTTNNRMELLACIKVYEYIKKNFDKLKKIEINQIKIFTDSEYVYQNQNNAVYWRQNKWRNKEGRPIENPDLWKKFIAVRLNIRFPIEIQWIPGKSNAILKKVDKLAKKSAKTPRNIDFGYRPGKVFRTKVLGGAPVLFPANSQEIVIRIYRKAFLNTSAKKEYKITFDLFSKEENNYTEKCFIYTSPIIERKLKRSHCYKVKLNNNSNYPIIIKVLKEIK